MKTTFTALTAAALLLLPGAALAQNAGLNANFGSANLRAGFTPDPYRVQVVAGGSLSANALPGSCTGSISNAPDFELTYTAGSLPLAFRVVSGVDTTLVINGPDGTWSCDDDSFGDGDPQVVFRKPMSGVYDVWIGTFNGGTASGTLGITETP